MGGRVQLTTNCCSPPLVSEAAALDDDDELKLDEMIEFDMTLVGDIWAGGGAGLDGDVSVGCSWVLSPPSFDHDRFWTLGLFAGFGGGIGATTGLDVDADDDDEDDENGEASCDDTDVDLTKATDWAIDEVGAVGCDEEEDEEFDGSWRLGDSTREFDSDDEDVDDDDDDDDDEEDDDEDDEDNIGEMGHSKCDDWSGVWLWVVDTIVGGVVVDEVETKLDDWASK